MTTEHVSVCDKAPKGWKCSRRKNHAGPCAAYPAGLPKELPVPDKHPYRPYEAGYADGYNDAIKAMREGKP